MSCTSKITLMWKCALLASPNYPLYHTKLACLGEHEGQMNLSTTIYLSREPLRYWGPRKPQHTTSLRLKQQTHDLIQRWDFKFDIVRTIWPGLWEHGSGTLDCLWIDQGSFSSINRPGRMWHHEMFVVQPLVAATPRNCPSKARSLQLPPGRFAYRILWPTRGYQDCEQAHRSRQRSRELSVAFDLGEADTCWE